VFIALVLVAAIAAGVLINTAGFLQSQAEATGEESTSQVSDSVQLVSASAVASDDDEIQIVELRVSLAPGADRLNLSDSTIEWVGQNNASTLNVEAGSQTDYSSGSIAAASNAVIPSDESQELTQESDRTTILLISSNAGGVSSINGSDQLSSDLPMNGGDDADVTITVSSGGQTTTTLNVPSIVKSGEGVSL
jgi:flagellin FlaB